MEAPTVAAPRVLCRLEDIEDGQGKGFFWGEGAARQEIFVLRVGEAVYGYENSCPHQGTPLDWTPDQFICEETGLILCATHGAQFKIEDGTCVDGPCVGDRLRPMPVRLDAQRRVVWDGP